MSFFTNIGLKIWGYIATGGALIIAIFLYGRKKKIEGREEVKDAVNAKTTKTVIEIVKEDKEIEKYINTKSDDDVLDELLKGASDRDNK